MELSILVRVQVPEPNSAQKEGDAPSDFTALELSHQVIAGTNTQRHDRQRGVLARIGREARSIHHEKILDVMGSLKLIEH